MFAEAATEAGIPDGVVNVVTGAGPVAGEALIAHPDVDMVSFTGSTAVGAPGHGAGRRRTVKRVHLELGGKAPFVVFDDADLEAAVHGAVAGSLINTGQDCTAATRAYVQRPLYDAFVAGVADLMGSVRLGDPFDPHRPGPADLATRSRSASPASSTGPGRTARRSSAAARCPAATWREGAYYEPTLVADAPQDSEIVQDEIFGPVLVVLPFDADDEGIALANDTPYGLAASAWTPRRLPVACAPPARSARAASGSTTTSRSSARCRTAATRPPASARTCRRTPSTSTPRSST